MASVVGEDKRVYTVLFVDDEENILRSIRRAVIDETYLSYFASSGAEALEIMEKRRISVIVTDMRMPGMDGLQLLKIVKEKYPNIVKIVLSGFTQLSQVLATINQADIFNFIAKPWDMETELKYIIDKAIEHYRLKEVESELQGKLEKRNVAYQGILKRMETTSEIRKKQIQQIQRISNLLLGAIDRETKGESQFLATVLKNYTEKLPGGVEEIALQTIISDLQRLIAEKPYYSKTPVTIKGSVAGKIRGSSGLMQLAVTSLLNVLQQNGDNGDTYFYIVTKEQGEKVVLSFSVFLGDAVGAYQDQLGQCSYQLIERVFHEIMDVRFVASNKNSREILQLEFELEKI